MSFTSIDFAVFVPLVFLLYWFVANRRLGVQNALLVVASYTFYGWWDWRFLFLIVFSSLTDYCVGLGLAKTDNARRRRFLLLTSITVNLGLLGFFKYYNFFLENFVEAFRFLGYPINPQSLEIILPVGISFYTFQTLSYTIDVYRRRLEPTRDIVAFFAFVAFFPQLVAGPIERASNLLPQFQKRRVFSYDVAVDGMRQILWGLFTKIVIADNCAALVNDVFANYNDYSGKTLFFGVILFSFQIYGDFSGYSDIAIGTSRLFGFDLMRNFAFPYFSRDVAEFWRRWHISLSTWFRDYVYIPLGGNRGGTWLTARNVFLVFVVSGLWHGANWTFIVWGALHATYFLSLKLLHGGVKRPDTVAPATSLPSFKELLQMATTFLFVMVAWVFFRAESVYDAVHYLGRMFSSVWISRTGTYAVEPFAPLAEDITLLIAVLVLAEWLQRKKRHGLQLDPNHVPMIVRWVIYYAAIWAICTFRPDPQDFIYFQF